MTCGITCGDINGIGPEIIVRYLKERTQAESSEAGAGSDKFLIVIPPDVFDYYNTQLDANLNFRLINSSEIHDTEKGDSGIYILSLDKADFTPGKPTRDSGTTAFNSILKSYELINAGAIDFIVTAPISKYAFRLAGIDFPGHTELFAALDKSADFMMCFLSESMKCGLATIHEPLSAVPALITQELLEKKLRIISGMLQNDLLIDSPQIAVLGLNPHAGENGLLGREEQLIIDPFVKNHPGLLSGAFPPDSFFGRKMYSGFDFVLGMYHDQLLIPFKLRNQNAGVNYTAGLSFVRTSPDHGTGYDIAGKLCADASSLAEAVKWGALIAKNRKSHAYQN